MGVVATDAHGVCFRQVRFSFLPDDSAGNQRPADDGSPMAACSGQYVEAVLCQLFALTGYLNAFYFYEQKEIESKNR